MMKEIQQSGPIKTVELRSPASVNFGAMEMPAEHYRLRSYSSTILNGRVIYSPFSGELYFAEEKPNIVHDELVMTYEGAEIVLKECRLSERFDEVVTDIDGLLFGIEFSYALRREAG